MKTFDVIKPPTPLIWGDTTRSVGGDLVPLLKIFLGGTIEMGAASNWQDKAIELLRAKCQHETVVFNPRRDNWDSSWQQSINNRDFKWQVEWELAALRMVQVIYFNFEKDSRSPITLMELGIASQFRGPQVKVCCPDGFWRKGNVEVLCNLNNIPLYNTLEDMIEGNDKYAQYEF